MLALAMALVASAVPPEVVKEVEVRAVPGEVWKAWATGAGAKTFFAPDAKIEAKPGGAYELYFGPEEPAGKRGSEGCTVVSAAALKKLVFTWNFPPSIPALRDAKALTQVTVELFAQGKTTKVKLTQTGWKEGADWEKGRAYFDRAWGVVLDRLAHRFRRGPLDWKQPWSPVDAKQLEFLVGAWESKADKHVVLWRATPSGFEGADTLTGDKGPTELPLSLYTEAGDWVLESGWVGRKPNGDALPLVLDALKPGDAVFVSEAGEPVRVEYRVEKGQLEVWVNRARSEAHVKLERQARR